MKKQKFFRKSAALLGAFLLPAMSAALPCTAAPAVTLYGDINRDGAVNASDAACILEYAAAVGAGFTGTLEDFLAPPPVNEDGQIQLGTAILEADFNDLDAEDFCLAGDPIFTNGKYDCTWDISGCADFDAADTVYLRIENIDPYPLGVNETVVLTVEEVWLDGVKAEVLTGKPQYAFKTDNGYDMTDVTLISFPLRNAAFNDLEQEFTETVRIVFTLEGLSELIAE